MAIVLLKVRRAIQQLERSGVIAYPTEAVWGFGCDADSQEAVVRLLKLKHRSVDKGLILVAASVDQFAAYLDGLSPALMDKFAQPTERPVTWLVPANNFVPDWIKGRYKSVALRVSTHKPVVDLCRAFGKPIVSTSANRAGQPPCKSPWPLYRLLGHGLDYIFPGPLGDLNSPSEIRDLISNKVIRGA